MTKQPRTKWLLERGDEYAESYAMPDAIDDASIRDALGTCYASLCDDDDESRIIAMGEPDRRIVEMQVFGDSKHYVLANRGVEPEPTTLMVGLDTTFTVMTNEVLTKGQAVSAF